MSFLAREAQRGRIQQIMKLIDTKIRPEIQRAVAETFARPVAASGSTIHPLGQMPPTESATKDTQSGSFRIMDGERTNAPAPGPGIEDMATATQCTIIASRNAVTKSSGPAGAIKNSLPTSLNHSSIQGLSRKTDRGIRPDSSGAWITNGCRIDTTFSIESVESEYVGRTARFISFDQSALVRIAVSLRHLRSGHTLPKGFFEGATSDDLSVLDNLYQSLSQMVQAIDRRVDALVKTASDSFNRHMVASEAGCASKKGPRRFKGQEGWQTGTGKKTHWNANADWGSEMAWSEVEVKQAEPGKTGASSKLRHHYVPCEWNLPNQESSS
jgi:hypothetical protein